MRHARCTCLLLLFLFGLSQRAFAEAEFTPEEKSRILAHGPWPMQWSPDPSNRVSGNRAAIALGRYLFFDEKLSRFGALSCASCHKPSLAWGDGRAQASSAARLERNTLSLYNLRHSKWFGWDGATDKLWLHSIRPILDPREMAASPAHVQEYYARNSKRAASYRAVFGDQPANHAPEMVLVNSSKALAAFQETIVSSPTPFDDFRDAMARNDTKALARYSPSARRGLKLFVGKANCYACHSGPMFSNGEFYDIAVPSLPGSKVADTGRSGGLMRLAADPINRLRALGDDTPQRTNGLPSEAEKHAPATAAFKVPSLRNVALTGPYMHNGSKSTLAAVVLHYTALDQSSLDKIGTTPLRRVDLSEAEVQDLVSFLESLTEVGKKPRPPSNRK